MVLSRRELLRRGTWALPGLALGPGVFLRSAIASPTSKNRNLIIIELAGGNDGLNTLVPYGLNGGSYYSVFRQTLGVPEADLLKIPGEPVAFAKSCIELKALYDLGRVAIIQGVGYPVPNFSHEISRRIWHAGTVGGATAGASEGWLARYLNVLPPTANPTAAEIGNHSYLLTEGANGLVPAVFEVGDYQFPLDAAHPGDATSRKLAYTAIVNAMKGGVGLPASIARTGSDILGVIEQFKTVPDIPFVGAYSPTLLSFGLQTIIKLIKANFGMRVFHIVFGGFDTHSLQNQGGLHQALLRKLSMAIGGFHTDLIAQGIEHETLTVVCSEFGRRVYENGSAGTDHGTVNPMMVIGSKVLGGFVNPHPAMDPTALDATDELPMQADYRDVFGTILQNWYAEPTPTISQVFPGHAFANLGFMP